MNTFIPRDILIRSGLPAPYDKIHIFDRCPNYVMDYHTHEDWWHINYIVSGGMELYVGEKHISVHKNQLIIIPSHIPHKIISDSGYTQIGVDIIHTEDERNIYRMIKAYCTSFPLAINVAPPTKNFEASEELLKNPLPLNITTFINMFEKVILDALNVMATNKKTISARLTQIISENNPFTLTLSDICRITNYSKTQVERLAVKELGCGITTYLNNIKINEICSLLQSSDLTMAEIADRVGLYDASHLTTFFKKHIGTTPGKFRKNHLYHLD